ncbi:hypothetical protein CP532_3250 [Ophiocordyceps camponoti-leonardi (nom. inval.)]|nr:hypothetical protein CP532_3250 [Ophiocordyceps camponoti-leonardi (nom. inval.)]
MNKAAQPISCPPLTQHAVPRKANFPNLRRLFIEARTDDEEREVSRKAFYNAVLFMASVAVFSLIAQKLNAGR